MKLIKDHIRRTGNTRSKNKLITQPTFFDKIKDTAAAVLPNGISITSGVEGEFFSEEWAKGDLLVDVCKDDDGHFINRKELDFTPYPDSQFWINEEKPSRVRDVDVFIRDGEDYMARPTSSWR